MDWWQSNVQMFISDTERYQTKTSWLYNCVEQIKHFCFQLVVPVSVTKHFNLTWTEIHFLKLFSLIFTFHVVFTSGKSWLCCWTTTSLTWQCPTIYNQLYLREHPCMTIPLLLHLFHSQICKVIKKNLKFTKITFQTLQNTAPYTPIFVD